jgi:hypothetical protein
LANGDGEFPDLSMLMEHFTVGLNAMVDFSEVAQDRDQ